MAKYKIADLVIRMDTFGRTERQAASYMVDPDTPHDFTIFSERAELMEKYPHLSEDECEYMSTCGRFYRVLPLFDGIMLHSSCVVVDDRAYLFTAPSGTGKSTHTELWLKLFGDRAYILNDDKPAIRIIDDKVYVYGSPWSGKHDIQRNARAELGGIAILRRGKENMIRPMDPTRAVYELMSQTVRNNSFKPMEKCLETIGRIISTGKVYELFCNTDISAAKLSYETMSEMRFTYED